MANLGFQLNRTILQFWSQEIQPMQWPSSYTSLTNTCWKSHLTSVSVLFLKYPISCEGYLKC